MQLIDLLKKRIEEEGITPYKISLKTGVSQSTIGRILKGSTANSSTEKILMDFLLSNESSESDISSHIKTTQITKNQHRGVPYYENMDVTATIATSFSDYPEAPTFYIDYEHFNDCTAYVPVVGDSMYPSYCSGEIIAVKSIFNLDIIQWGEAYFVVTNGNANDMRTIKQLHYHDDPDKIILRSSNPNFKGDTIISKKDILFLYIVKGKIRRNQL